MALHCHTFCNVRSVRGEATASWIELRRRKSGFYSQFCLAAADVWLNLPAHQCPWRASPMAACPAAQHCCCHWRMLWESGHGHLQEPQGSHSSSTGCRAGAIWGLLGTRTAIDGLTLPPPNTHFLSILACVWAYIYIQAIPLGFLLFGFCCSPRAPCPTTVGPQLLPQVPMPSVFPALLPSLFSSFPYPSSLYTFSVLFLTISSPPLFSPKLPLPKETIWREALWSACTWMNTHAKRYLPEADHWAPAWIIKGIRGKK